ncbi:MAG: hypothetical protein R2754_16025 [Microthrixaceae bacterium]
MNHGRSAGVADLARRLDELGVLESWDPGAAGDATYRGAGWNPELTQPGDLHVNLFGGKRSIAAVDAAARAGATAVVWQGAPDPLPRELSTLMRAHGVPLLRVSDERRAYSLAAALLFGFPDQRLRSVGITGTNAKTTTAVMLAACLQRSGIAHGLSTSVVVATGDRLSPPGLTTPDAPSSRSCWPQRWTPAPPTRSSRPARRALRINAWPTLISPSGSAPPSGRTTSTFTAPGPPSGKPSASCSRVSTRTASPSTTPTSPT